MQAEEYARRLRKHINPTPADKQTAWGDALLSMWRACRVYIPQAVHMTDADLQRQESDRAFFEGRRNLPLQAWERENKCGEIADRIAGEIAALHIRREIWTALCDVFDAQTTAAADDALMRAVALGDAHPDEFRPFVSVWFGSEAPVHNLPAYQRYATLRDESWATAAAEAAASANT